MFGPVSSQMRPASRSRRRREVAIVGDERPAVGASACSTTGWRPPSITKSSEPSISRPHVVALDRERRQRGGDVEHRQRLGRGLDRRRLPRSPCAASRSKISSSMPSARSAALAILASSSPSSVVVKRTWPASVWRWMKVALSGARQQLVAVLRGHLDEIAEHVVVPDLQRAHAGLVGVARLQRRDHPARFVAQRARLVERGVVARAHEAAVALEQRQLVGERRRQARAAIAASGRRSARRAPARSRPAASARRVELGRRARRPRRCRRGWRRDRAGRRGRPPAATARARDRARPCRRSRTSPRAAGVGDEKRDRVEPPRDRLADRSAARPAAAPAAASPPPSRCGRWRRAASRAARRASVRISSRLLRVAWSIGSVAPCGLAQRRRQRRALAELRALHIGDAGGGRGELQPRQRAERLAWSRPRNSRRAAARRSRRRTRRA